MKVSFVIVIASLMGFAAGQNQINQTRSNQSRVDYIRLLGKEKPDASLLRDLMDAISAKDQSVRLEALRVWQLVGKDYYQLISSNLQTREDNQAHQNWQQQLISKIEPRPDDSVEVTKESVRTMCGMGRTAESICPPMFRCGLRGGKSLSDLVTEKLTVWGHLHPDHLAELLEDTNPDVVLNAWQGLETARQKEQLTHATVMINRSDWQSRAVGAYMISGAWPEKAVDLLVPMLDDADKKVHMTAHANIFFSMSDQQAFDILANNLLSINLRKMAVEHLRIKPSSRKEQLLRKLIYSPEEPIRIEAVAAFFVNDEKKDPVLLLKLQSDPSKVIHKMALEIGARAEMTELLPFVKDGLLSSDPERRGLALWAAGKVPNGGDLSREMVRAVELGIDFNYTTYPAFDDPRFKGLLEYCLNSKIAQVRNLVQLRYEHELTGPFPKDIILRLANDEDPFVSESMIEKLAKIPDSWAHEALLDFAKSKDLSKQRAAIRALGTGEKSK